MAVADVQKVNIIAHKKDRQKVVSFLHDVGLLEVSNWHGPVAKIETPAVEEEVSKLEYKASEVQFAINFLDEYKLKEKLGLVEKLTGSQISITASKVKKLEGKVDVAAAVKKCTSLEEAINKKQTSLDRSAEEKELLTKWIDLNIKIDEAQETKITKAVFGVVDSEQYLKFIRELEKNIVQVDIRKVTNDEQKNYLLIIFNKQLEKEIDKLFFKYGLEKVELPSANKTPRELLTDIAQQKKAIRQEIKDLKSEATQLAKQYLKNLKILFDYFTWGINKKSVQRDFKETKSAFVIVGWTRKDNVAVIRKGLAKLTANFEVVEVKPEEGEPAPVIIRNSSFMKPFEAVTGIYGLPKSSEVDPTPFLSIFFIIFFGLCLTDAGYGLVLMILTYLAIKVLKIPKEKQRLIRLLMYGGFVTFIIGALTGGWFGIVLDDLPSSLGFIAVALNAVKILDPIESPIIMLILSFALGYVHILTGITIDLWWKIKNKRLMDGLLDSGTWLYFLLSIGFYGATAFGILPIGLKQLGFYLFLVGLAVVVLTQGRKQKNPIMKLLAGVGSLYGLVGYMSDILSYSRLLALGLATGVIAMVINLIAVMFKDMIPVVGWVFMVLIIIGGHIFNITINVLGAYIHSGRLQFVEFFPKFFQGGGKIFKPFKRESKYTELKNG